MRFEDDYLWDGTGEPDEEIERLEGLLGRYRSTAPAPELPAVEPAPVVVWRPRRLAVAAAVAACLALAIWVGRPQPGPPPVANLNVSREAGPVPEGKGPGDTPSVEIPNDLGPTVATKDTPKTVAPTPRKPRTVRAPEAAPDATPDAVAANETPGTLEATPGETAPLATRAVAVDFVTARHVEDAELLLRSVRNADLREDDSLDLAYDAQRARELLDRNVLLRRAAEARGNAPSARLLGDVEPYLLDIANLGTKPAADEVRSIQDRIERKEIVTDLRLYAMQSTARGF